MLVSDYMVKNVVTIKHTDSVKDAAKIMISKRIGALPVLNADGKLVGVVTQSDFIPKNKNVPRSGIAIPYLFNEMSTGEDLKQEYEQHKTKPVSDVMSTSVWTTTKEATLLDAANLMMSKDVNRLPVMDGDKIIGIISRHDLLKAMIS